MKPLTPSLFPRRIPGLACTIAISLLTSSFAIAQTPATTPGTQGPRAGSGVYPATEPDDNTGFVSIFDGKSLTGWDGDPRFWRVDDGAIVGESTPTNVVAQNNFLIWRGG